MPSKGRLLSKLIVDSSGDVASGSLDNVVGTTTSFHAFKIDSNGDMQWYTGDLALEDAAHEDQYDLVIVGSTDQTYSLDDDGYLVCSYT